MSKLNRRDFVRTTTAGLAGTAIAVGTKQTRAAANERMRVAQIGCGGRGNGLVKQFAGIENVEVAYTCDPDSRRAGTTRQALGNKTQAVQDFRIALDDKSIEAVIVATPDHWHAPAALLALEAGKHVYVEKPCSHNVREGRMLVESARRNKLVVQHGTQSRSSSFIARGIELLRDGIIGDVLVAKAWNVQRRGSIGHAKPSEPPTGVDYDTWIGPAEMMPSQSNRFHYNWHWWYNFGTGDTGNDGVHELDIARWGLGVETHPSFVSAAGGKFVVDDDQQFPDTQYANYVYAKENGKQKSLVFEMRLWSRYGLEGIDNGNAFYGTKGWMLLSKRGVMKVFDESNREVAVDREQPNLTSHYQNFIDAVRGASSPRAEIEVGHLSATLCHLGNIATRVGRTLRFDPDSEQIVDDDKSNLLLSRTYREDGHWSIPKTA